MTLPQVQSTLHSYHLENTITEALFHKMFSVFVVGVFGITGITVGRFGQYVMRVLNYLVAPEIINPTAPIINVENDDIFLEINEECKRLIILWYNIWKFDFISITCQSEIFREQVPFPNKKINCSQMAINKLVANLKTI